MGLGACGGREGPRDGRVAVVDFVFGLDLVCGLDFLELEWAFEAV